MSPDHHSDAIKVLYAAPRLQSLRQSLAGAGYQLHAAWVAEAHGEGSPTRRPDICLVDMDEIDTLGNMDQLKPIAALRIPLVFVAREINPQRQDLCQRLGAMALLPDDVDAAALAASLRLWVERDREMRALRASELRLQDALLTTRSVSQAVGVLAERHKVPVTNAFQLLRAHARDGRKRIEDMAKELVPQKAMS